jgi:DNA-binding winged helix-turn-helix (wHTH) protein
VALEPLVFDLLIFLVTNRDRVVSKEDGFDAVWHGRIVSESALTACVAAARRAIGDSGEAQKSIRTIPRKEFRFVGDVRGEAPARLVQAIAVQAVPTASIAPPAPDWPAIAVLAFTSMSAAS